MLEKISNLLEKHDPSFCLYQYPSYLIHANSMGAHILVDRYADDDYTGLRESWRLIDPLDITDKVVCEIGCNIGATSYELITTMNPRVLYSYDPSWKAVSICEEVRRYFNMSNWDITCAKFEYTIGGYDTIIWEDPHTSNDGDIVNILVNIYKRGRVIYFLECDNIYHLIKDEELVQLSENSWKLVL